MALLRTPLKRRFQIAIFVCLGGLLVGSSGCHRVTSFLPSCEFPFLRRPTVVEEPVPHIPTYSLFSSPQFASNLPQRVVMIEAGPNRGDYNATQKMINELTVQIRSIGAFEVIAPPNVRLQQHSDNILEGKFDEREIAQLSRKHNADAVALVRVNQLQGHAPMRTSVTMAIVDSSETVVVFAIDGIWDTSNAGTYNEFRNHVMEQTPTISVPVEVRLQSPQALFSLVAKQIAEALRGSVY